MGTLTYDSTLSAQFDDRLLAHLEIVVHAKLRRNESFSFAWSGDESIGQVRSSIWLNSSIPLSFVYSVATLPQVNPRWIAALTDTANSPAGLRLVPEPE